MNRLLKYFPLVVAGAALVTIMALTALGQETVTATPNPGLGLTEFIAGMAEKFPVLITVLSVIGVLRVVFKPIMSAVQAGVKASATTKDDEILEKVEHSKAYTVFAWLLDYLGSIKVGPQLTVAAPKAAGTSTPETK